MKPSTRFSTWRLVFSDARWIAVWRRNFLVWRKLSAASMIGNFGDPLLYLLALGYGLGNFVGSIEGMPYVTFLASGIVCSSAMNTATFEALYSAYTRMTTQQTWAAMLAAPLDVDDIVLGEMAWAGTKSAISAVAILVVAAALGIVRGPGAVWIVPLVLVTGTCFGAMALVVTALSASYDFFLYYFTLVITPMTLLSGVFFPIDTLPAAVRWPAELLPLTHAVDVVRPLLIGRPPEHAWIHVAVILAYTGASFAAARVLVRRRLLT